MYDFKETEAPQKLNRDFILSKISDAQIFYYYFGKFDLKTLYPSKFASGKHGDKNPSTGFYISKSGKIIYNHLNGREEKMDCFAFVCRLYNIDFSDALRRIAGDFGLLGGKTSQLVKSSKKALASFDRTLKKDTKIHFVPESIFSYDAWQFWKSYHIDLEELKREGVYQIKKLFINERFIPNSTNCLRFALTVPYKDELLTKVYSPGGKDQLKWVSNIPLDLPFGLSTLNKDSGYSFTAKAVKDMIVLKKFLPSVIASQNENWSSISEHTIKKLTFYFEKNYVGWDNDWPGLRGMVTMRNRGFLPIYVPVQYRCEGIKDFSDLAKEKGLKAVEELLKQNNLI
jgi:hypothetical protein